MKFLKTLWALLPLILAFVVYFGYLRALPTLVSLVLFIIFAIVWFCRKQIADTVISKLKHIPALEHFLWDDAGQKKDENGKLSQDRKPIESNIKLIKIAINAIIILALLGIPMLIIAIIGMIGGLFDSLANCLDIIGQDLALVNGVGFLLFAIAEILVTLAALAAIVFAIFKCRRGDWDGKKALIIALAAFFIQRLVSWFYFGSTVSGAIGELFFWGFIAAVVWAFKKFDIIGRFRAWRRSRPIEVDHDDYEDDEESTPIEDGSDDDDFIDPV